MILALEALMGAAIVGASIVQANAQHHTRDPWWRRAWTVTMGVGALWIVLSAVLAHAPVLRDVTATVVRVGDSALLVTTTGTKVRACRWIRTDAYVTDTAGNKHEASITWIGDRIVGNTKPLGRHRWEPALVEFDRDVVPVSVEFQAIHSCGWMWHDVTTQEGPWKVPR